MWILLSFLYQGIVVIVFLFLVFFVATPMIKKIIEVFRVKGKGEKWRL